MHHCWDHKESENVNEILVKVRNHISTISHVARI